MRYTKSINEMLVLILKDCTINNVCRITKCDFKAGVKMRLPRDLANYLIYHGLAKII